MFFMLEKLTGKDANQTYEQQKYLQSITCVSVDINGHSTEDAGARSFLLLFSGGIKSKLLVQLTNFGSHVAALHAGSCRRQTTRRKQ